MAHIVAHGKRPLGWEQVYTTTGAARERDLERAIVRVYDNGSPFEHNGSTPVLLNVTSAGQDAVVADSARYYLNSVPLSAASRFAVAHGLETLAQLCGSSNRGFSGFTVADAPEFPYRALMIDCGRRFVPLPTLYEIIDGMAYSKMSVLNLHASEYGFFRIAIKAFPELTSGLGSAFYSQTDIQQLVEYAHLRGIRVVPQIGKRPADKFGMLASYM